MPEYCRNQIKYTFQAFLISLILCFTVSLSSAAGKSSYTLAVIPNQPAVTLNKNWGPLAEHLSRELGVRIELKLYDKLNTFIEATKDGEADFIYSSPNLYYLAYQKQKYIPLVRSSILFRGRVFVRKDSPYTKVSDLRGKSIAFVGPKTVCAVIAQQAIKNEQENMEFNSSYGGSSINVAKSVLLGKADAGATLDVSMMSDVPEMMSEFRTLLETEKIAPHPLAAHPRVAKKLQDALTAAVLELNASENGRKILEATKLTAPVKADFKKDYSFLDHYAFDTLEKQLAK